MLEIKKGDILLVHSKNITGRLIQFGMNVEKWRELDFKPAWKYINNHAAICIEDNIIAEALSNGITVQSFESAYGSLKGKILTVYRPKWEDSELSEIKKVAVSYNGVKYQFINFLQYVPKIFFGVWVGKTNKSSEDALYCTEYVSLVINKITKGKLFKKYWKSSPNDVQKWCEKNAELVKIYNL